MFEIIGDCHCGGEGHLHHLHALETRVTCSKCGISVQGDGDVEAVSNWNEIMRKLSLMEMATIKTYKFGKWSGGKGKLFECPFCGGEPKVTHKGNDHTRSRCVEIKCTKCRCFRIDAGIRTSMTAIESVAVKNWNQRHINNKGENDA